MADGLRLLAYDFDNIRLLSDLALVSVVLPLFHYTMSIHAQTVHYFYIPQAKNRQITMLLFCQNLVLTIIEGKIWPIRCANTPARYQF